MEAPHEPMNDPFPDETTADLLRRIDSCEGLHLLASFTRVPERRWTLGEVAEAHPSFDVEAVLADLRSVGLVDVRGGTFALTADPATRRGCAELCERYRSDPIPFLRVLTEGALERVRNAAARTFADAFVIRRRDE